MLLKLGLANRTYKNIYQQFSFENEYNCFVAKFYFCFLLQSVPNSYTKWEKSKYIFTQVSNNSTVYYNGLVLRGKTITLFITPYNSFILKTPAASLSVEVALGCTSLSC